MIDANLLLRSDMRPCELLLELIGLVTLFAGLFGLLVALLSFVVLLLKVWDDFGLPFQDLRGLADILHARLILLAKLAQLSTLEEELHNPDERV